MLRDEARVAEAGTVAHGEDLESHFSRFADGLPLTAVAHGGDASGITFAADSAAGVAHGSVVTKRQCPEESFEERAVRGNIPRAGSAAGVVRVGSTLDGSLLGAAKPDLLGNHATLGQSACLVRDDVRRAAHGLKAGKVADDDIAGDHGLAGDRHGDSEDREEGFRNHSHAYTNAVQKHLIVDVPKTSGENDDGKQDSESKEEKGELAKGDLQGTAVQAENGLHGAGESQGELLRAGLVAVILTGVEKACDLADLRFHGSRYDDTDTAPAADDGAGESKIAAITKRLFRVGENQVGLLARGDRLASQHCFVGGEIEAADEAQVSCNHVAGSEDDDVALDESLGLCDLDGTVPEDLARRAGESIEGLDGLLGTVVLDQSNHDVQQDHGADDGSLDVVVDGEGDGHDGDEDGRE